MDTEGKREMEREVEWDGARRKFERNGKIEIFPYPAWPEKTKICNRYRC